MYHAIPALLTVHGGTGTGILLTGAMGDVGVTRVRTEARRLLSACHVRLAVANAVMSPLPTSALTTLRAMVYRRVGFRIGRQVAFMSNIKITGEGRGLYQRLIVGRGSFVGTDPLFNLSDEIIIGDNVSIGPYVRIYTSSHTIGPPERRRSYAVEHRPVAIGDGTWVCVGATILPGVTIGAGSVIAAGSVVADDVAPNTLVSGVPATFVKQLSS